MSETCKAAWSGGKCGRAPGAARGVCEGHYGQWRRQTDTGRLTTVQVVYTELRVAGEPGTRTVPVTVHLPQTTAEKYKQAAKGSGKGLSEFLRPWLDAGFKRHQARKR